MFATLEETVDQARDVRRTLRRRELVSLGVEQARIAQRITQIVRAADDEHDWHATLMGQLDDAIEALFDVDGFFGRDGFDERGPYALERQFAAGLAAAV